MNISLIDIASPKIPICFSGYKICQISDLHNRNFKGELLNKIDEIKPNIIVITGDIIDRENKTIAALSFCEGAIKLAPVYYVNGNHESVLKCFAEFKKKLITLGVNIMENTSTELFCDDLNNKNAVAEQKAYELQNSTDAQKVVLLGMSDPRFFAKCKQGYKQELAKQMQIIGKKNYTILITHRPEMFADYVSANVDLVFAGHAHGGQVRLPIIGALYAPNQGFFPKLVKGAHKKNNTTMVISRGLGKSTIIPRIFNQPELIIATLNHI